MAWYWILCLVIVSLVVFLGTIWLAIGFFSYVVFDFWLSGESFFNYFVSYFKKYSLDNWHTLFWMTLLGLITLIMLDDLRKDILLKEESVVLKNAELYQYLIFHKN